MNPRNTIYDAKRFIGRVVLQDDPIFQVLYLSQHGALKLSYFIK